LTERKKKKQGTQLKASAQYVLLLIALVAVCGLIALQLYNNHGNPDSTTLGLVAFAAILLLAVGAPTATKRAVRRISGFKIAGVEVALREADDSAKRATATLVSDSEDGVPVKPREKTGSAGDDLAIVRARIENRLELCRNRVLGLPKGTPHDVTLANLLSSGLLTRDEAKAIGDALGGVGETIEEWPEDVAAEFLDSLWAFVSRLGSTTFDRKVRRELATSGWVIADFAQGRGHRPDFLGYKDGSWHLLTARVSKVEKLDKARKRLAGVVENGFHEAIKRAGIEVGITAVVIPDSRKPPTDAKWPEVAVMKLSALTGSSQPERSAMFSKTKATNGFAVDDINAAEQFYGETLGLGFKVMSEEFGVASIQLAGGRNTLVYVKPDFVPATYTILNFEVDDVDAAVDELADKGVELERYDGFDQDEKGIARGGGKGPDIAWFKDPAGNILSVLQQPS
jgi:predicted enzyme related to lactoylglutathione lyase